MDRLRADHPFPDHQNAKRPVDFHDHSLLNARLNDDKSDAPFVDYLHALYAESFPT